MQKAHIVLGLGYGDEGKGITTDFLVSNNPDSVVVRFSGGQQAGHTVIVDGVKHVHSNFGAGTLRGVPTYFTEHTVFYPATIFRENAVLDKQGIKPTLILHPLAKLTTPFDVFANRQDAVNLDDGTCGLGIGKTMKRNDSSPYKLYAIDLLNHETLLHKLSAIGKYYNFQDVPHYMEKEMETFMLALHNFNWIIKDYDYLKSFENIVMEGSQGIQLDMEHGVFPNVTYAHTTSKNAHQVLDILGVSDRNTYYVTRTYATRHGNGPFVSSELNLVNNSEEINVTNNYQGNFRTGLLNYDMLNQSLRIDGIYSKSQTHNLVVTCNDQLTTKFDYDSIVMPFDSIWESYSPDSKDFIAVKQL